MVLTQVQKNGNYIIHAIRGESSVRLHLEGMGFVPGTKLSVLSRVGDGVIVKVKDSRVALDANLASCILV